jgi:Polyketide cyclase / dehydrase and lipid transport
MASIRKELSLSNSASRIWDAMRDFQAVHTRVAPGFLLDNKPEDGARVLTFANGAVIRELLVACDEPQRRLVYAIAQPPFTTYSASVQIFDAGSGKSRLTWTVDFLPNELAGRIDSQMEAALKVMKPTLEGA